MVNIARGEDPGEPGYKQASVLRTMYWDREMSIADIGDHFDTSRDTIQYWLNKFDIPTRSRFEAQQVRKRRNSQSGGGSESGGEPGEDEADGDASRSPGASEEAAPSQESDLSISKLTRREHLDRQSFCDLFYTRGLSPGEACDLLGLEPKHLGTLMRIHGVGSFGHGEVPDDRRTELLKELSDREWSKVVK